MPAERLPSGLRRTARRLGFDRPTLPNAHALWGRPRTSRRSTWVVRTSTTLKAIIAKMPSFRNALR
eukprot:7573236-Lingulodinium_polyedra.AAC.1